MGFRGSFFAAQIDPAELAQALGMTVTNRTAEEPDSDWWSARLNRSGWSLLLTRDTAFGDRVRREVSALSQQTDVLHCEVCETTMWSSATCWSKGAERWRITHDGGGEGVDDLNATGDLPAPFAAIRDRALAAQRAEYEALAEERADLGNDGEVEIMGTDFVFEVPIDLFDELIGYRYDRIIGPDDVSEFLLLEPPSQPSFWARLFGRG